MKSLNKSNHQNKKIFNQNLGLINYLKSNINNVKWCGIDSENL